MNEWLLGCRPRADCCLASLSQAGRITSFSREPRMLCGTEKRQQRSMKAVPPSLPPSVHPWLVLFLALAALPSLFPSLSLYRTHAAAESVMPAAAFPLPPAAALPASGPASGPACSGLPISAWERTAAVDRPRPPGWIQFLRSSKPGRRAPAPKSGPRRMLCTYQRGVAGAEPEVFMKSNQLPKRPRTYQGGGMVARQLIWEDIDDGLPFGIYWKCT